jgi:hypothetical protein
MTHATQLAVFSLWTGIGQSAQLGMSALDAAWALASPEWGVAGADACARATASPIGTQLQSTQIHAVLPSCPECLALCHLAMVEHDRFREMEEPRHE